MKGRLSHARSPIGHRRPIGHRPICHSGLTLSRCSHSGTWSWVKLVSVPESPPLGLHDTVSVQPHRLLHGKCTRLAMFNCPEVVYGAWRYFSMFIYESSGAVLCMRVAGLFYIPTHGIFPLRSCISSLVVERRPSVYFISSAFRFG